MGGSASGSLRRGECGLSVSVRGSVCVSVCECVCVLFYMRPVGKYLSVCMCLCGQKHACVSVHVPACVRWGGRFQVNERVCARKGISVYVRVASV